MAGKRWYPKKQAAPLPRIERAHRNWSPFQKDIFSAVEAGENNLSINACPGSGKSTTLVESLYHIPEHLQNGSIFLAFAKKDQIDLERRVPVGLKCQTSHAFGFAALKNEFKKVIVDNTKCYNIAQAIVGADEERDALRYNLVQAINLCKGHLAETNAEIENVIEKHEVEIGDENLDTFVGMVKVGLTTSARQNQLIDFNDMIWLPVKLGLKFPQFQRVFGDEMQDWNTCQLEILKNVVAQDGKLIICSDKNQQIYTFRAARETIIDDIVSQFNCTTLPLSISYRCAKNIVRLAQTLVPEIQSADSAPDGDVIEDCPRDKMIDDVQPGDFIISRTNAPLVRLFLSFFNKNRKCSILGKDMASSLAYTIKLSKADSVSGFIEYLNNWKDEKVEFYSSKNKDYTHIVDKYEVLMAFVEGCSTLGQVEKRIREAFGDEPNYSTDIILTNTHHVKGKEADRCFLLTDTYKPSKNQEEKNLLYVAYTRARHSLYLSKSKQ